MLCETTSDWNVSILSQYKRLYIFTGKGGVGKTTISFSFSQYLQEQNKKYALVYFKSNKLGETKLSFSENQTIAKDANIQIRDLDLTDAAKGYIARKLKSKTIAEVVIRTPFFKSLLNMIPGFNYIIYLGQILQWLEDEPELIIVLDAPASGHTKTMLEATTNFQSIFKSGALFEDTKRMLQRLHDANFTKINIISLASILSLNESIELKEQLNELGYQDIDISCNKTLDQSKLGDIPDSLAKKIEAEKVALLQAGTAVKQSLAHCTNTNKNQMIKDLVTSMQSLV